MQGLVSPDPAFFNKIWQNTVTKFDETGMKITFSYNIMVKPCLCFGMISIKILCIFAAQMKK